MHDVSRKEKYCINVQLNPYFRSLLLVHVSEISRGELSSEALRYWGSFVLILTVVTIIAHIIISIIFNIIFRMTTGEKEPTFADELDKLIEMKANRISFFMFIIGFLLAMGTLVMNEQLQTMFIILIIAGFISDVIGSVMKLYYYRKGV